MRSEFLYNADGIGSHCHSGCLVEHDNEVYATWYGYVEKEYEKGQICLSKYNKVSGTWSKAQLPFGHMANSCGNPVLFSDPADGNLYLFFVILQRHYWDSAQIFHSVLKKGELKWSSPEMLQLPVGMMIRHRPLIKSSGTILIPAYDEKALKSIIYESTSPYTQWKQIGEVEGELIQGDLIQFSEKELQLYLRPASDYPHQIYRALSPDAGKTFGTVLKTSLYCPLTGLAAIRLQSGHTLICHNHTEKFERTPLTLSLVKQGEVAYSQLLNIDSGPIELSYPSLLQQQDGTIHLLYTYNRKMMKHIIFDLDFKDKHGL